MRVWVVTEVTIAPYGVITEPAKVFRSESLAIAYANRVDDERYGGEGRFERHGKFIDLKCKPRGESRTSLRIDPTDLDDSEGSRCVNGVWCNDEAVLRADLEAIPHWLCGLHLFRDCEREAWRRHGPSYELRSLTSSPSNPCKPPEYTRCVAV